MQLKEKTIIKSPLNFTGGKYKLLPQLLPLFPKKINSFIDLFCGGCNVSLNIDADKIICNDNDNKLIELLSFFQKNSFTDLFQKIKKIISNYGLSDSQEKGYKFYRCNSSDGLGRYNKRSFLSLRSYFNSLSIKNEDYYLILYTLIIFSFNNQIRFNSKGQFNIPVGKRDFNIRMQNKLKVFLSAIKQKNIIFMNNDFSQINPNELKESDFVYADPPYLITCATYNERGWNEIQEKKLLEYLDNLTKKGIQFALSNVITTDNKTNYILKCWLEDNKKYNCYHLNFSYKNSNYQKKNIGKSDEVLITNY